ncbi:achaete-scute homolog 4 [Pleurodeles waltl]
MDRRETDGAPDRIPPYPRSSPLVIHVDHHALPNGDPYGIAFPFDSACWGQVYHGYTGCFPYLSLPSQVGLYDSSFEPSFIRKRNQRERQRVRFVNEGYTRLRQHLPQELAEKHLSKVETLRAAISYIRGLQGLLGLQALGSSKQEKMLPKDKTFLSTVCLQSVASSDGKSGLSSPSSPYSEPNEVCSQSRSV